MASKYVSITGFKEVDRKLHDLPIRVTNKLLRGSLRKAIKPIQVAAKANAPVDTGELKKAIKIRSGKRKKNVISISCVMGAGDFIGDQFYGSFLEFGAPHRNIKPMGFMRRAYDSHKEEVRGLAIEEIKDAVNDATK